MSPIQTQFPAGFLSNGNSIYQLRDALTDMLAAGEVDGTSSVPGPGKRMVVADSAGNLSIGNGLMTLSAVAGDLDPASYWTKSNGSGFARESGLALVAYHQRGVWVGWSNSTDLQTSSLIYGAKGRDSYVAGTAWTEVLPLGDAVHIIVLTTTGAQHFARVGLNEYLVFTYPAGVDAELYPALLGKVASLENIYVYPVTPAVPLVDVSLPTTGLEFSHPQNSYLIEFDVLSVSGVTSSTIVLHQQDAENYLRIDIAPSRQMSLYRIEAGVTTLVSRMSDVGDVVNGSRVVVQMRPPSSFITSNGSGTTFKAWVNGKIRASTGTAPFGTSTSGNINSIAAGIPLANFKVWNMTT